eukprot:7295381-Pyramimonas_sp.AAC.1
MFLGPHRNVLGALPRPSGALSGLPWALSGRGARILRSWSPLGLPFGPSRNVRGSSRTRLGPSWGFLRAPWEPIGPLWGGFGSFLGGLGASGTRKSEDAEDIEKPMEK